ncbi:MAG: hypothetical protein E2590_03895 [Chryseobacterium sp.]|nr:hypothetical protein [Chryseobacterium sp.]
MRSTDDQNKSGAQVSHKTEGQNNQKTPAHSQGSAKLPIGVTKNQEKVAKLVAGQAHSTGIHKRKP